MLRFSLFAREQPPFYSPRHPLGALPRGRGSARRRTRPRVEVLEARTAPAVLVVTSLADAVAAGDGLTLREAVQAATTNMAVNEAPAGEATPDTIVFAAGLQGGTITLDGTELLLTGGGDLSIVGPGGVADGITIDGNEASRVLQITAAADSVTLMDLTLTRGNAGDTDGGGLLNQGPNTRLINLLVTGNRASAGPGARGGGIANTGMLTLADSTLSDNQASSYGGGLSNRDGTVMINRSRITGNRSDSFGGGVGSTGIAARMTLTETTVDGNEATILGGGVANDGGTLAVRRSTVSGNEASIGGGGIDSGGGALYIAGSTLAHNLTDSIGGGLRLLNSTVNIVNTTVARNTSFDRAGGISHDGGILTLTNSIVSLNRAANTADNRETLSGTFNNNDSLEGGNPRLTPLQDNGGPTHTLAPLPDNPEVIDQGTNALAVDPFGGAPLDTDQRGMGFPRLLGGAVDRGAVEFFSPRTTVSVAALLDGTTVTSTATARRIDLRATVEASTEEIFPTGSVLFFDDLTPDNPADAPTPLNSIPLPLDAMGQATLPGVSLSAGTHNLFARFTPGSQAFRTSASPPRTVTARAIDTVGVFDPMGIAFQLLNQNTTTTTGPDFGYPFGAAGSLPVVGNWTGSDDGIAKPGAVTPFTGLLQWNLADENPPVLPNLTPFFYGSTGQVPLAGDWDGDGTTGIGVFDPATATFALRNSLSAGAAEFTFAFGAAGFLPVVGNWDSAGGDEVGVYDPATGTWFLAADTPASGFPALLRSFPFGGGAGTRPVAGDWDGDGTTGIGVFGPTPEGFGQFLLRNTPDAGAPDVNGSDPILAGLPNWLPLAGNWGVAPLPGNPLLALVAAEGRGPGATGIGEGELDFIVSAALNRLEGAGVDPGLVQALARGEYLMGATPAGVLGYVDGNRVVLSPDGAGHGWFVDPTPAEDGDAFAGYDLLSAVLHEMGHLAGLGHDDNGLMADNLAPGVRPLGALDAVFARGLF